MLKVTYNSTPLSESNKAEEMPALAVDVEKAYQRIKNNVRKTPLEYSAWLSECSNCNVYIKLESEQVTNSFKLRGAFNKINSVCETTDSVPDFITASSGNHGMACGHVLSRLKLSGKVFVPNVVSPTKLKRLNALKIPVIIHGNDCVEAEKQARKVSEETAAMFISPYNDWDVIAGNGTVGCEIFEDLPLVDVVFIAVGGGGLISGMSAYLKAKNSKIKIVGCQPENSQVMIESLEAGQILELDSLDTLADGTAGGIEEGAITFELCKELVDQWVSVSEDEIGYCVYNFLEEHSKVIEGAAGVAIAAFQKTKEQYVNKNVVILSCGGNISVAQLKKVIDRHWVPKGPPIKI